MSLRVSVHDFHGPSFMHAFAYVSNGYAFDRPQSQNSSRNTVTLSDTNYLLSKFRKCVETKQSISVKNVQKIPALLKLAWILANTFLCFPLFGGSFEKIYQTL